MTLCTTPPYALSLAVSDSDVAPATNPIPSTVPCRLEKGAIYLKSRPLEVITNTSGSICLGVGNLLGGKCYAESVNLFVTVSTYWDEQFDNGTQVPLALFDRDKQRTLTANVRPSLQPPGDGNRTDCKAFSGTTTSTTATGTRTSSTAVATGTLTTSSRVGSAARSKISGWALLMSVAFSLAVVGSLAR